MFSIKIDGHDFFELVERDFIVAYLNKKSIYFITIWLLKKNEIVTIFVHLLHDRIHFLLSWL